MFNVYVIDVEAKAWITPIVQKYVYYICQNIVLDNILHATPMPGIHVSLYTVYSNRLDSGYIS